MNKLNVGDYVRTKSGTIAKIKSLFEKEDYIFLDVNNYICGRQSIIKSSPRIIDLIEAGDYVNGYKVIDEADYDAEGEKFIRINSSDNWVRSVLYNFDIKTVVTHEQFSQVKYGVGE